MSKGMSYTAGFKLKVVELVDSVGKKLKCRKGTRSQQKTGARLEENKDRIDCNDRGDESTLARTQRQASRMGAR